MVIAEQNVSLLEGRVDRIIGMHAGKLKGEASAALMLSAPIGRHDAMDIVVHHQQRHRAGQHLRHTGDRHFDHLVEPRPGQPGLRVHLLLRRLWRLAGRAEHLAVGTRRSRRRHPRRGACRRHRLRAGLHSDSRQAQLHGARAGRHAGDQPASAPRRCSGGSARARRACRRFSAPGKSRCRHRVDRRQSRQRA